MGTFTAMIAIADPQRQPWEHSLLDLWVLVAMGAVGYGLRKLTVDPAPLIVALVLGPIMEKTLRQSLFMTHGDWRLFVARPLALALLLVGATVLVGPSLVAAVRGRRALPAASSTAGGC
jgi:putative tricarboxylic transport membrane protein